MELSYTDFGPEEPVGIDLIYESIYSGLAMMDSKLQIWSTFTFALLVAVHVGGARITKEVAERPAGVA